MLPEISPGRVKTNTQAGQDGTQQVLQELHLSSEGSNSDAPEGAGETSKGTDPDNSGMSPPIPPEEPRAPPGTPSLDQVPGEGQDTPTPTRQEVNPADPNTSAPDLLPMPAEQTQPLGPSLPDSSATAASGLGQDPLQSVSCDSNYIFCHPDQRPVSDPLHCGCHGQVKGGV